MSVSEVFAIENSYCVSTWINLVIERRKKNYNLNFWRMTFPIELRAHTLETFLEVSIHQFFRVQTEKTSYLLHILIYTYAIYIYRYVYIRIFLLIFTHSHNRLSLYPTRNSWNTCPHEHMHLLNGILSRFLLFTNAKV